MQMMALPEVLYQPRTRPRLLHKSTQTSIHPCVYHVWRVELLCFLIGPDMGSAITSLAFSTDSIFAAAANYVGRYVRGKEVGRMVLETERDTSSSSSEASDSDSDSDDDEVQEAVESLTDLTIFGTTLIALSSSGRRMFVWDIPTRINPASIDPASASTAEAHTRTTPYATIDFPGGFTASKVVHPASYLNKVVVGSKEGALAVWNVRTA